MDHFALLPAAERATVFREAASRSRLGSATIIEKDFWVCWTLQRIFSSPTLPGPLFKGYHRGARRRPDEFPLRRSELGAPMDAYRGTPAAMVKVMIKDTSRLPPGD